MIRSDLKVTTVLEFDCVEDMQQCLYELRNLPRSDSPSILQDVRRELECREDQLAGMGLVHDRR